MKLFFQSSEGPKYPHSGQSVVEMPPTLPEPIGQVGITLVLTSPAYFPACASASVVTLPFGSKGLGLLHPSSPTFGTPSVTTITLETWQE